MNLAQQLEDFEGRRACMYLDSLGFATIGIGRLIDSRKGSGLTDDEIDYLLANDIREKTQQVMAALPWASTLNEPRQAVLIGMAFQMGTSGLLGFTETLAAIRDQHYDHAAALMLASLWAKQSPARAQRLSRQMSSGDWQ